MSGRGVVVAIAVALGCGSTEAGRPRPAPVEAVAHAAPGIRLGDAAEPLAYDLTLELDPHRDAFAGRVAIAIAVAAAGTTELWLHAVDLEISRARVQLGDRVDDVALLASDAAPQQRGFRLPRAFAAGERITLLLDYTGRVADRTSPSAKDEEGLFRQRRDGRWYLYSQAESIFARRIVPCFDEPRWKPAWRVTAIVPADQVALGNAPVRSERALPGGRREVRFAELAATPSYLIAVAVGPFDLVEAGRLGRGHTPVRIAVPRGERGRVGLALQTLPRLVAAVEDYVDQPLPLAKLDVVAVPQFFGAMENPGLITIQADALFGSPELVPDLAHELAHQWFGNAVTPAWWDQLWLSEAFATWLGQRIAASLPWRPPPEVARAERVQLLAADAAVDAAAMTHPVASDDEIEPAFDAIVYGKGAAVLAMFERFTGADAFRAALRGYLAAHAGHAVTSQALFDALAAATDPAVSAALASNLGHAGLPVVAFAIACGATPSIIAEARDGVTVPVCVRYPASAAPITRCLLAGAHSELALPAAAGCPAWLVGNEGGRGYYRTAWRAGTRLAPLDAMSREERAAHGDDVAGAVEHGDLGIGEALAELAALAASGDPDDGAIALTIADAIDPLVAEPTQPAWRAWLAHRFADRLAPGALRSSGRRASELHHLLGLVGPAIDPRTIAFARTQLARDPSGDAVLVEVAAAGGKAQPLFDRIVNAAAARGPDRAGAAMTDKIGRFPGGYAPQIVELMFDRRFAASDGWLAVAAQLQRSESRGAAWRALHARFAEVAHALPADQLAEAIDATSALCTAGERGALAADLAALDRPAVARAAARALATIDRCIARRAALGDVAAALAQRSAARP